jgi:hypothetical protein
MSIHFGIVLSIALLFGACAQVEPLSGGDQDRIAPKPNMEKMSPPNGSTNFSGNQISIPFDEFIRLNNPGENIIVIPPDIKPKVKIKNKTLVLSWEETMKPNTTYAFYLNGAVQDYSEKNDSLMSFVLSTGASIDSLTSIFTVRDAFSKEPLPNQTVGFYEVFSDTILPNYFSKTDRFGKATLSYMKPGEYELVAFSDLNKNLKPEKTEGFGFRMGKINLTESTIDSIPVLLSPSEQKPQITTLELNPPGSLIISANRSLKNSVLTLNGQNMPEESFVYYSNDSLLAPFSYSDSTTYELIVENPAWTDTSTFRMTQGEKNAGFSLSLSKNTPFFHDEPIVLNANQTLSSIDIPTVTMMNAEDSSAISLRRLKTLGTTIELDFDRKPEIKSVWLKIPAFAILADHSRNEDTLLFKIDCLTAKEVGVLNVQFEGYETAIIVDLVSKGKLVNRIALEKGIESYTFKNLAPGEYSFRITIDENENGRWDGGEYYEQKLPEDVRIYLKRQKVRSNWETDILLKKEGDGE